MKNSGYCLSYINIKCSEWRDSAHTWPADKQVTMLERCMKEDCEQSLETGKYTPGCRFVDHQGFCYNRASAQMWCADDGEDSPYCGDLGGKAAFPPLGTRSQQLSSRRRLLDVAVPEDEHSIPLGNPKSTRTLLPAPITWTQTPSRRNCLIQMLLSRKVWMSFPSVYLIDPLHIFPFSDDPGAHGSVRLQQVPISFSF